MKEHRLGGAASKALSHLMVVGLASILEESGAQEVTFAWSEDTVPFPRLWCALDPAGVAEIVHRHATRHSEPTSWMRAAMTTGELAGRRLFAPRAAAPKAPSASSADSHRGWDRSWRAYEQARQEFLDLNQDFLTDLDLRMLSALGEPAWWRCTGRDNQPDVGASRWEMKARNQGQDFVQHRLGPLAESVAARSREAIWLGLAGLQLVDEHGGGLHSRTPTGLSPPGPTDNAQAWCALWGLSALPTIHLASARVARGHSQSPGTYPRNRVHPQRAVLPVFTSPTTTSHYRSVCVSAALDQLVVNTLDAAQGAEASARRATAVDWLKEQGVKAVMHFVIEKAGTSSAPERWLLAGHAEVLS